MAATHRRNASLLVYSPDRLRHRRDRRRPKRSSRLPGMKDGSVGFVPVEERIATFDNDGTLWTEQPMYVELAFSLQEVVKMAPKHPDWQTTQPFAAVLHHDMKALAASGDEGMIHVVPRDAHRHDGGTV